ncbi:NUDIX hydrolase [Corynebacterium liangguodongii]|uniref:NUDIX hydrolase n=1 Tax=Corynebacterium liangguodongii TaxID=2079535 RepID=A0A2S0WGY0_9CORY|nr:NUDIX hydrolase [Corynebacterium liangguodongii]PWB98997.1 NUDIX hydrolase [Corynebacterium liangguodongii]
MESSARLACTVILTRDGETGLEVWVFERVMSMPNYPGMTVFPGGGVDSRDFPHAESAGELWYGRSAEDLAAQLKVGSDTAYALLLAAVRELFEETGTLLAVDSAGDLPADAHSFHSQRVRMESHELSLTEVLRDKGLRVTPDLLLPFARWVGRSERGTTYDTFTWLARLPEGQQPDGRTGEADDANWFPPALLIDGWRAGLVRFAPSTWAQLLDISEFATTDDLWEATKGAEITLVRDDAVDNPRYAEFFTLRPEDRIGRPFEL